MNNDMFQKIFDILIDDLPTDWSKIVYLAEFYDGSFSMKYYVKTPTSDYISCYDMENFDNNKFIMMSIELNNIISTNRLQLSEDKRWSAIAMTVESSGKMYTDFDYANVIEDQIEYEKNWEEKHLI